MSCPICIEKITPSRKCVCPYCSYECCKMCVQRFLTESPDDANCMNCHRAFDRETLLQLTSKSFLNNQYRKHREDILLERETSLLPATVPHVERELVNRENLKVMLNLQTQRLELKRKLNELDVEYWRRSNQVTPTVQEERREFIHNCASEFCKGFLSTGWKCSICNMFTCSECNTVKGNTRDAAHECNENDTLTFQVIKTDSRKCPGCATFIYKISGCDQMWCTACQTAFSWRTGKKVNNNIHNPHFYEFQRRGGQVNRELGDIPCGGMPSYVEIRRKLYNIPTNRMVTIASQTSDDWQGYLVRIHRLVGHISDTDLPRYRSTDLMQMNMPMRIKYMLNEIPTNEFKVKLQQHEKKNMKKNEIYLILSMVVDTIGDIFRQFVLNTTIDSRIYQKDIETLVSYANTALLAVSKQYTNSVVPQISSTANFLINKCYRAV